MNLSAFFKWLQTTTIATTFAQSTQLMALLSGVHLLGLTLLVGGALVSGLRLMGILLPERPVSEVAGTAGKGMVFGLAMSVATGMLLFATRASMIAQNSFFRWKMVLLLAAAAFYFAVVRRAVRQTKPASSQRIIGAMGLALWIGVALAGCAFILFE